MSRQKDLKSAVLRTARTLRRNLFPAPPNPDWARVIAASGDTWQHRRAAAQGGPKVLIATGAGGHRAITPIESTLAAALTLRGAEVHLLLCDEALPACLQTTYMEFGSTQRFVEHGPAHMCGSCVAYGEASFVPLGLPIHYYGELITPAEADEARHLATTVPVADLGAYSYEGLAIGEHALAGALRYFAKGDLGDEPLAEPVLRRYFEAALRSAFATRRLLRHEGFAVACFHHGIYVPQGVVGEVCRAEGVRVVNWNPAYRKRCFIFSHEDTYHHTLMDEPTTVWENMAWDEALDRETMDYLRSRWDGSQDWISFVQNPQLEVSSIEAEIGIDLKRPTVGLLTNVVWDAQLHYPANAFPNMIAWIRETVAYFAGRPELQLLIRVHPAEQKGAIPSRQPVLDELRREFPTLPPNVFVIPPESSVSTYAAMLQCDSVIIYGTKTGVELTSLGVPVIVAGEAWIRNKGITHDARSVEEYRRILDGLPVGRRLEAAAVERARKYAYHFFFRRMVPIDFVEPAKGWPPYVVQLETLAQLEPGQSRGLDVICDGVMAGTPFVFPAEQAEAGRL